MNKISDFFKRFLSLVFQVLLTIYLTNKMKGGRKW